MPQRLVNGTLKRQKRRKYKYTKKNKTEMTGGFWFFGPSKETKFIYILSDYAMSKTNISKNDNKLKKLVYEAYVQIFKKMLNTYNDAEIKIDKDTQGETISTIFNGIKSIDKDSSGKYQYKLKPDETKKKYQYLEKYMIKLLSIIDEFIKLLNTNTGSVSNSNYDDTRYKEIREPISYKKTQDETFSTIMFFGGNDGIERLPNFIYRIINPYVPASNTDKERKKPILSRTTAQEFINSSTNVAKALYYFMKYKSSRYSRY